MLGIRPNPNGHQHQPLGGFALSPLVAGALWTTMGYRAVVRPLLNDELTPRSLLFVFMCVIVGINTHTADPERVLGRRVNRYAEWAAYPIYGILIAATMANMFNSLEQLGDTLFS